MAGSSKEDRIGLPEAAELLGVHYMTAYRYVRTGRLSATSVGGVWQLDPADVRALAEGAGVGARVRGGSRARAASMVERRVLEGDESGAFGVCEGALASWATPAEVYTEVLVPAMRSIGQRWHAGELSVADEHRAASVAIRIMGRLGPRFVHPGRRRGTMVIGAPAGDHHSIPVAVVRDLLRDADFSVVDLGAHTPAEAFVDAARISDRLVAVAVGSTLSGNEPAIAATVEAVHHAIPGIPVIVGGAGVPTRAAARRVGADEWSGTDGRTVVQLARGETV